MKKPKVALVHDYLVQNGGAEKTLEALIELFPEAPIYTSMYKPTNFSDNINSRKIITPKKTNFIFNLIPILSKYFTFLLPLVFEGFNLDEFDIVISDSSSYAKGVLTKPRQMHICYIHTPPRFMYKYSVENTKRTAWFYNPVVMVVDHLLRMWDFQAAQRADYLVANSKEIKKRIKKFYKRDAYVIYPPVELARKNEDYSIEKKEEYYLLAGRLTAYKNFDKVIKAFNELPAFKLKIIGTGPEEKNLKKIANDRIEFLGRVDEETKHRLMHNAQGLVNAVQDEDFGIVPIEVLSHGVPALVHRSAGHLETVENGVSGKYFDELSIEGLKKAITEFSDELKSGKYKKEAIIESVQKFSKDAFKKSFYNFVIEKWQTHKSHLMIQSMHA